MLKVTAGLVRTRSRYLSWSVPGRGSLRLRIHASTKSLGVCHLSGGRGLRWSNASRCQSTVANLLYCCPGGAHRVVPSVNREGSKRGSLSCR